ncbi:MAG: hypothetical protein Q8R29_01915 [bacterium]|nr:hypothetical protein [bacterium]
MVVYWIIAFNWLFDNKKEVKVKTKREKNPIPRDKQFNQLVKDLVRIIKKTDREIEKMRKVFPEISNPLKPTKRRRKK